MNFGLPHWTAIVVIGLVFFYIGRKTTVGTGLFTALTN